MSKVFIILSSYQGEHFLADLLATIRAQSFVDWTLLARDDGSTDGTRSVLVQAAAEDVRIEILEPDGQHLGPFAGFAMLMQRAYDRGAEYLFLADQDDLWHVDKLARLLAALQTAEQQSPTMPCLAYSDAAVIDGQGHLLAKSFLQYTQLPYRSDRPLATLLGRSFVLGCACGVNRALLSFALPVPEKVASHDWWLALCAASVGEITLVDAPLFDYRRHIGNHSAPAFGLTTLFMPELWRDRWNRGWQSFCRSLDQAALLDERLQCRGLHVRPEGETLRRFLDNVQSAQAPWKRVAGLWRLGLPRIDWRRRLLFYVCLLLNPKN